MLSHLPFGTENVQLIHFFWEHEEAREKISNCGAKGLCQMQLRSNVQGGKALSQMESESHWDVCSD